MTKNFKYNRQINLSCINYLVSAFQLKISKFVKFNYYYKYLNTGSTLHYYFSLLFSTLNGYLKYVY